MPFGLSGNAPDVSGLPPKAWLEERLRALGVHQHEENAAGLRAAIDPGVIGRLLNHDVTGLEVRYRVIKHHVDLASQDHGVVDGSRAVHQRMFGRKSPGRRAITDHLHHEIGVHFCLSGGIEGWKLDHRKRRASVWWQRRPALPSNGRNGYFASSTRV